MQYTFAYDTAKRPTEVKVGNQTLSSTAYNTNGTVQSATYGNGGKTAYTYDTFERATGVKIDGDIQDRYTYNYNANGQVAHVTDNRLNRVAQSEYDLSNRPMRIKTHQNKSHVYTGEVGYDVFGNLMEFKEKVGTAYAKYTTTFGYDEENRPTTLTYGDASNKQTQAYDSIGRIKTRTLTVDGKAYNTSFTYEAGGYGANSTTPMIKNITQDGKTTTYAYDDAGNILSVDTPFNPVQVEDLTGKLYQDTGRRLYIKDDTGLERILYAVEGKGQTQVTASKVNYTYDKLGQLTRTDDPYDLSSGQQGTTTTYSYDLGGNILEKRVFPYTQPNEVPIGAVKVIPYAYTDANWKDKLTAYNGKTITYDAIGNPLNDGTWNYTWESGRQLASMSKGNGSTAESLSYTYNASGLRVKKAHTKGGVTTTTSYTLHGKNIIHMTQGSNNLHFFYDAQNRPAMVNFNGVKYGYICNLQGDIVALVDSSGNQVVEYAYDAWGKILSTEGSMASTLGTINPFRYRGYVYDEETGLYYLRSRYYNPVIERFINADGLIDNRGLNTQNVFQYCQNNPINNADPSGNLFLSIFGVVALLAGSAALLSGCTETPEPYSRGANCYAYALKLENDPRTNQPFIDKPQPGEFSGNSLTHKDLFGGIDKVKQNINTKVKSDTEVLGMNYIEVESASHVPTPGNWVVSLAYATNGDDYHWWRRNDDGTWSHKPGVTAIIHWDASKNTIIDPGTCDRGIYDGFLGYYEVGPN